MLGNDHHVLIVLFNFKLLGRKVGALKKQFLFYFYFICKYLQFTTMNTIKRRDLRHVLPLFQQSTQSIVRLRISLTARRMKASCSRKASNSLTILWSNSLIFWGGVQNTLSLRYPHKRIRMVSSQVSAVAIQHHDINLWCGVFQTHRWGDL